MPQRWHCLELWRVTPEVLALPLERRIQHVHERYALASDRPFPAGAFKAKAPITTLEAAQVAVFFAVVMGGPVALIGLGVAALATRAWGALAGLAVATAFLAAHPLPDPQRLVACRFTLALYKYFSYRIMWVDDAYEQCVDQSSGWIGAAPPHGVLPIANVLSMPALNAFTPRRFVGGGASVVLYTPFLRYMTMMGGAIDVSAASLYRATKLRSEDVGVVPDGIAGLFQQRGSEELVALKNRKGLARLSLKKGIPIVPAYSLGNTAVWGVWYDSFGIMEGLSRRLKATVFVFWGRFGLPIPFRANISLLIGSPIVPPKSDGEADLTDKLVDETHSAILQGIVATFDTHKDACGWGHRTLRFV